MVSQMVEKDAQIAQDEDLIGKLQQEVHDRSSEVMALSEKHGNLIT